MADKFFSVFHAVLLLTAGCALLTLIVACLDAAVGLPYSQQLISMFADGFKMGFAGILGLMGGRALSMRRR